MKNLQIHRRIKALGMTYTEIAEQMGIAPSTFSDLINGRIRWTEDYMQMIVHVLGQPEETIADFFPRREVVYTNGRLRVI